MTHTQPAREDRVAVTAPPDVGASDGGREPSDSGAGVPEVGDTPAGSTDTALSMLAGDTEQALERIAHIHREAHMVLFGITEDADRR